jgi:predicted dehydrogenase
MRQKNGVSRRRFLRNSAAGTAAAISFPYIVPNAVLAQRGRPGANDRIVVGSIGVGGRGGNHLDDLHGRGIPIAGICDVDARHVANAAKRVGGRPFTCKDYRQLLDRKDIDAIVIATPDHWHAIMMIDACQAGKDVYTEKPTCRTIQEGDAMINAAEHYKRVVQVGAQGRSEAAARRCAEYVRNGEIGKVNYVDVWHPENFNGNNAMSKDGAPPAALDWEQWLGPARWRQYNADYHPFNFRWLMEIGGGFIRDRGNHVLSCVFWTMDADKTGPVSVEASGDRANRGNWDVPIKMKVTWEFKNPDWTVTWKQPGQQRPLPGENQLIDWGAEFRGDKGSVILVHGDSAGVEPKARNYEPPANGVHLFHSPGHMQNWLDCIKTRQEPIMPIRAGVAVITLPITANISYVLGRKLDWDAAKRQFVGDDEANRMLADPYRWPWHV